MKLKTIASAVSVSLAALALTACGGSDNSAPVSGTTPTNPGTGTGTGTGTGNTNPGNNTGVVVEAGNANSTVVTNANTTINNIDTNKTPVVHTHQYVRGVNANFDRVANPTPENTADWGASTDLEPNSNLSNFVIGTEGTVGADGKLTRWATDYLGEYTDKDATKKELNKTNSKYTTVTSYNVVAFDGNPYDAAYTYNFAPDAANTVKDVLNRFTIQEQNRVEVDAVDAEYLSTDTAVAKRFIETLKGIDVTAREKSGLVGYKVGTDNSLVVNHGVREALEYGLGDAQTANDQKTRVYGRNYREVKKVSEAQPANSYVANYDAKTGEFAGGKALTLNNTQYGRLTAWVDAMSEDPSAEAGENTIAYRAFTDRKFDRAVDFYFHRGTNATTIKQMDALKAEGGTFTYKGHALTYGVAPITAADPTTGRLPTAFGESKRGQTFGDFVEATYDVAKGTVTGNVYNFYNADVEDANSKYKKQDLINFSGEVHGNTVIGSATRIQGNEAGSLLANFYGDKAQELGGNINSITKDVGYGEAKWGAVFGAQRVAAPKPASGANFNTGAFNGSK